MYVYIYKRIIFYYAKALFIAEPKPYNKSQNLKISRGNLIYVGASPQVLYVK